MQRENYLHVQVSQLVVSNVGFVLLLKAEEDPRSLPIFIGAAEAQAIAISLNKTTLPRPLTHDLLKNLLDLLECRMMRVDIVRIESGTYFAHMILDRDGTEVEIDVRPSDAIALALRTAAPIFLAREILEEAGRVIVQEPPAAGGEASSPPRKENPRHEHSPVQALKQKLEQAVKEERYEDAARFRDEIARLEHTHTDN